MLLSITVDNSIVAMVTDLAYACSHCIISEKLPEIHTMKKCDFLKPIVLILYRKCWLIIINLAQDAAEMRT